jgi:DNA-binding transcriptional ArsR family regulator
MFGLTKHGLKFRWNDSLIEKYLRNRIIALIFATEWLHKIIIVMKRDIFQAIADPTRRAILILIAAQAMTPNALAEQFNTTRQAVSKHIKILCECEIVRQEKVGRQIYYQLEIDKMEEIDKWLEQIRHQWEDRFNQLDNVLNNLNS